MKFPKLHYERFTELIKSNEYLQDDFSLVKRRGWIRIEHISGQNFTYFKKKEVHLNPDTKEWEYKVIFKIKVNDLPEKIETEFDNLLILFDNWIKTLN